MRRRVIFRSLKIMQKDYGRLALEQAKNLRGKLEVKSKAKIENLEDLSVAYTPGVAAVSSSIAEIPLSAPDLTIKGNSVAVVSDGSSVLGLGNIGPTAALPVMEGKALLFKELAGIDAFPIVLSTQGIDEVVAVVKAISPTFGGINLEDIAAPRCFEIEEKLQDIGIPVFHDDQHGTAIVILAALTNALKVVGKKMEEIKVVFLGAGAAGIATAKILNVGQFALIDSKGTVHANRKDLNPYKKAIVEQKNYFSAEWLEELYKEADVFIGISGAGQIDERLIKLMNPDPIIFALSNPIPEIEPLQAKAAGAAIVASGRSDFPNQINNVLAFPGIFRGALDSKAKRINMEMKLAAAGALANMVEKPTAEKILPSVLDKKVAPTIAKAIQNVLVSQ